jgi:hypothetical protein
MAAPAATDHNWLLDDWLWDAHTLSALPLVSEQRRNPNGRPPSTSSADADDAPLLEQAPREQALREQAPREQALREQARRELAAKAPRARKEVVLPRVACQVAGCTSALLGTANLYARRVQLCEAHMVAPELPGPDGGLRRFCQRCHVVQPLSAFSAAQRSCDAALAKYNERRRSRKAALKGGTGTGTGTGSSRGDGEEDAEAGATVAAGAASAPADSLTRWLQMQGPVAGSLLLLRRCGGGEASAAELAAVAAAVTTQGFTLQVKLPHCATPAALPPPDALRGALGDALGDAAGPPALSLAPGCVRLVVDVNLPLLHHGGATRREAAAARAEALAAALRACCGDVARGAAPLPPPASPPDAALRLDVAALLLPDAGAAASVRVGFAAVGGRADATALRARCAGQPLRCAVAAAADGDAARGTLQLRASDLATLGGAGGTLLLDVVSSGNGAQPHGAPPLALLLCTDAAVVDAVNASLPSGAADADAAQCVVRLLGDALRPRAPLRLRAAAAAAAVWLRWVPALELLLQCCAEEEACGHAAADAAVALALSASAHAAASAAAPGAPAVARCLAAWLPGDADADAAAAAALRAARADGHTHPLCAAAAALQAAQRDGAPATVLRLLRATLALLSEHAPEEFDEAEALLEDSPLALRPAAPRVRPVEDEAEALAYDVFLMTQNRTVWQTTSFLGLLGAVLYFILAMRLVFARDAWPSATEVGMSMPLIEKVQLHRAWSALPPLAPRDVPCSVVQRFTRYFRMYNAGIHIPSFIVLLLLSWRRRPFARRHAPLIFIALALPDTILPLVCDALVLVATGTAPEYPASASMLVRAAGTWMCLQHGMARPAAVRVLMVHRALCMFGVLLITGNGRVLLTNYGYAANAAVFCYCALTAERRERKLRAIFAAQRAAAQKRAD